MRNKERIIRYLGGSGSADRNQIAKFILVKQTIVTNRLQELKHSGIVIFIKRPGGKGVWVLTQEGYRRYDFYEQRSRRESGKTAS